MCNLIPDVAWILFVRYGHNKHEGLMLIYNGLVQFGQARLPRYTLWWLADGIHSVSILDFCIKRLQPQTVWLPTPVVTDVHTGISTGAP